MRSGGTVPRHDDCILIETRAQYLVPSDQSPAVSRQIAADLLREMRLQVIRVLDPERACPRLHGRRFLPLSFDGFVAADVDVATREQFHHLVQHILEERESGGLHVEKVRVDAPSGGHGEGRCGGLLGDAEFRVGRDGRLRVARHFNLGDDLHVTARRIGNEGAHLGLRVKAAVRSGVEQVRAAKPLREPAMHPPR